MKPLHATFLMFAVTLTILSGVASFNYYVDPMCYFRCDKVDLTRSTVNTYYHIAQKTEAHRDAQIVMLGSSRGQTSPPFWIQKRTGLTTLNLSMGGAELSAKLSFLNLALDRLKLKKVVWFADYFELANIADHKIRNTPVLKKYLVGDYGPSNFLSYFSDIGALIDHNTLEAGLYAIKHASKVELDQGSGSFLDPRLCDSPEYRGEKSRAEMEKEKGFSYDAYAHKILKTPQSEKAWDLFLNKLNALSRRRLDVLILITPYHPEFVARLKTEYPWIYENHRKWITRLKTLHLPHVRVANYFDGLPGDDGSERYWNDGVHFNCRGSISMLKKEL